MITSAKIFALLSMAEMHPKQINEMPIKPIPIAKRFLCPNRSTIFPKRGENTIMPIEYREKTMPVYDDGRPLRSNSIGRKGAQIEKAAWAMKVQIKIQTISCGSIGSKLFIPLLK